jgi:hypothetical protein
MKNDIAAEEKMLRNIDGDSTAMAIRSYRADHDFSGEDRGSQ